MTRIISIPWGADDRRELALPDRWRVIAEAEPRLPGPLPEVSAELDRALANPIGLPPLADFARDKASACIVIDDRTRPTPVADILPRVAAQLSRAGLADDRIRILIAAGTHREMTDAEVRERVGAQMQARFAIRNHRMFHKEDLALAGRTATDGVPVHFNKWVTEAEVVVLVGCIEAHENAGFGGGNKNLMPGCSGPSTVHLTHHPGFQPQRRISHSGMPRSQNRYRRFLDECGATLGPRVYIINTVMEGRKVVAAVAGDPLAAHAAGAQIYSAMAAVRLPRPADVVIAGARPLDLDLRVSMKACFNAASALKPGGVLIMVSAVPDGMGDLRLPRRLPSWSRHVVQRSPLGLIEKLFLRVNRSPDQAVGSLSLVRLLRVSSAWMFLAPELPGLRPLRRLGIEFFSDPAELLARAAAQKPEAEVVLMPQAGASFVAWDDSRQGE